MEVTTNAWWRSAVVYQVYVRSFADSDGDGVGDLPGLIAHLDHIAALGVGVIWICPVYPSPQVDNGYDVSDYRGVDPLFGTLADLDELIRQVHRRGMRLILDLVVNHTSSVHPWFLESMAARDNEKADWYFWRDARPGMTPGEPGAEPNNWGSVFSGSAWEWSPLREQYYLHLFAVEQPDLNWESPSVREAVFDTMNWWLDRGVDGFRMDVINFISKHADLPDGEVTGSGFGDGMPYFAFGPQIRAYLTEMRREVFEGRTDCYLTVGEMPGVTPEQARAFTDRETGQLDMVFQFEHVSLDQDGDKWTQRRITIGDLRNTLAGWQEALAESGWNSLYWNNHDQPRAVSRFGDDGAFWYESATALATVLHLHRGTPYVYQGEELGMTNVPFDSIADFRDVESLRYYAHRMQCGGVDPLEVLEVLRRKSRDNARTPMQWTDGPYAGFSTGVPWIPVNPNHVQINAAKQRADPSSIYHYYRRLIELRRRDPVVVEGDFGLLDLDDIAGDGVADRVYAFRRTLGAQQLTVMANLSGTPVAFVRHIAGTVVLANRPTEFRDPAALAPWEARIYRSAGNALRNTDIH